MTWKGAWVSHSGCESNYRGSVCFEGVGTLSVVLY